MVAKSCLKQTSRPSSPQLDSFESGVMLAAHAGSDKPVFEERRKSVTFSSDGDEEVVKEEVFFADEWDRSPHQVTRKLNYRDMLELMELRLSLPRLMRFPSGRRRSGSLDSTE